ncbi:MAG: hypothetical protein H0W70_15745, partial [Actinobacteria bacterium]|nr:hypothetical protein [Actinomycetota bacterium]
AAVAGTRRRGIHDLPSLVASASMLLVLVAILPSALNLPQSNPTETPEFAPVPPEDDAPPSTPGNLAALGSAASAALEGGLDESAGSPPPPPPAGGLQGKNPSSKRCVGNPPRQTEDPLSPPCVGFFQGDNGGATATGVTKDEVRVLFVIYTGLGGNDTCRQGGTGRGFEPCEPVGYRDLATPPADEEGVWTRQLRLLQRHFNERYQTYGRFVHFFIYYDGGPFSPESRKATAADNASTVKPFAVVNGISGFGEDYLAEMARRGVISFIPGGTDNLAGLPASDLRRFPGMVWGFDPSVELRAENFAAYVCQKVVPFPVSFSGNGDAGQPRKLGLLWLDDAENAFPQLRVYADIVRRRVTECGGKFVVEKTFPAYCTPSGGAGVCSADPAYYQNAPDNMAAFKDAGVTTIIWAGGGDINQAKAAARLRYFPEIVLGGDNLNEVTLEGQFSDQSVWRHVFAVTTYTRQNPLTETPCYQAAKEVDPASDSTDIRNFGCKQYPAVRQLFTGIQVAGPRLGKTSMDKGFHAIPSVQSPDPRVPACFYDDGDYTCVKDAAVLWWDPAGDDPESTNPGCMRMVESGKRYRTGDWPREDVRAKQRPDDLCNAMGLTI